VQIVDSKDRVTHNRVVRTYKVLWSHHDERDTTWEMATYLREAYKDFYEQWLVTQKSRDEIFIRGEGCNTLGVKLALRHCINTSSHEHKHSYALLSHHHM
jgi:hypothetical protein